MKLSGKRKNLISFDTNKRISLVIEKKKHREGKTMHDSSSCERYRIMAGEEKEGNLIKNGIFLEIEGNDGSKLA